MRLPRDESGGRCSLGQNSATEGPVCQIGLAGSWLPQAKTTWGRAPCPSDRAQLDFRGELPVPGAEAPPPGGRGRPPLRGRADPARLRIPLHDRGVRQIGVPDRVVAHVFRKRRNHSRIVSNVEVVRQGVPGSWPPRRGSARALYSPYLLARNLPTSDSIWP